MIKKIGIIVKKVVFSFGILYGMNLLLQSLDIIIPINIYTLLISSLLGIPGILSLFTLFLIIN